MKIKNQTQIYTSILVKGKPALTFIQQKEFINKWSILAKQTIGFTICQEPSFVLSWYKYYLEQFNPIIIYAIKENNLVGLICLAWHKEKKYLTHAGGEDAEYHGWLANPSVELRFLQDVFTIVKRDIPISRWDWRWLPPSCSNFIFNAIPKNISYSFIEQKSPKWNLEKTEKLQQLFKSKSIRVKNNRFKKRGAFYLETITTITRLKEVFPEIIAQHDFIKEIHYNVQPYKEDEKKQLFFCELVQQGVGQMHVLWLNNDVIASHLGIGNSQRIYLCSITYSPSESKQSPGTLLLTKLGQLFDAEGISVFDLTPGEGTYKDRFANEYEPVYKFSFYLQPHISISGKSKAYLKQALKRGGNYFGIDSVKQKELIKKIDALKFSFTKYSSKKISSSLQPLFQQEAVFYKWNVPLKKEPKSKFEIPIRIQKYQDLQTIECPIERRILLTTALENFKKGGKLFTAVRKEDGLLQWSCWLSPLKKSIYSNLSESNKNTYLLHEFSIHTELNTPKDIIEHLCQTLYTIQNIITPNNLIIKLSKNIACTPRCNQLELKPI